MRKLPSLILFLLPVILYGQCHPEWNGILRYEVHENAVILRNDTAQRECGTRYTMVLQWLGSDTLVWIQDQLPVGANCLCHYNFSMTVDSLSMGNYVAKVYYTRYSWIPDTCLIGFMRFRIQDSLALPDPAMKDPSQSDCFPVPVGIRDGEGTEVPSFRIHPNPAADQITLDERTAGMKWIIVTDPLGRQVMSVETRDEQIILDISRFSVRGLYLITMIREGAVFRSRFVKY